MSETNCRVQGTFVSAFNGVAFAGHFILAVERFYRIVLNRDLTAKTMQLWLMLHGTLLTALSVFGYPSHRVSASGLYCLFAFSRTETELRIPSILCVAYCLVVLLAISFCYGMIYVRARNLFRKTAEVSARKNSEGKSASGSSRQPTDLMTYNNHDTGVANDSMQRSLLFRCLAVLITFVTFYTPTFFIFMYELISAGPFPSRHFAFFANIVVTLDYNVSPLLFIYLNKDYQRAIRTHILG